MEKQAGLSKPFCRANNANQIQGSGIGLPIVLRILEKNATEYKIESEMDVETIITLIFENLSSN